MSCDEPSSDLLCAALKLQREHWRSIRRRGPPLFPLPQLHDTALVADMCIGWLWNLALAVADVIIRRLTPTSGKEPSVASYCRAGRLLAGSCNKLQMFAHERFRCWQQSQAPNHSLAKYMISEPVGVYTVSRSTR